MNSSSFMPVSKIGTLAVIATFAVFALSGCNSGGDDGPVTEPVTDTQQTARPSPTARPTVTPVPSPTATAAPTSTPAPTPTPTPPPTATPTPPPPPSHVFEMGRLIFEQGIEAGNLSIISVGAAQWPDESLGCPEPGIFYESEKAPYSGFIYVLGDGSSTWEYHTNEDDSVIVRCDEIEPLTGPKVNISQAAGLHGSTAVTLLRRDFTTGQFKKISPMTREEITRLIDIFDRDIPLSGPINCETVFRLDFETPGGLQSIEWLCQEEKNLARGTQGFWIGMTGTVPVQVGEIIGTYLVGGPIPTLPTTTP